MKRPPFLRRFGFRVFLFYGLLLFMSVGALWMLRTGEYKPLVDRVTIQRELVRQTRVALEAHGLPQGGQREWTMPLPGQRNTIFSPGGAVVVTDSNQYEYGPLVTYRTWFPHEYIDSEERSPSHDTSVLNALREYITDPSFDPTRDHRVLLNVRTDAGLDRIVVIAEPVFLREGNHLLVVSSSVTDILLQNRAVKERFLVLILCLLILSVLLTLFLSRKVVRPFYRLYDYSRGIEAGIDRPDLEFTTDGEIASICHALQGRMRAHRSTAESFRQFAFDVAHELKTPLTAVRSGLEVCQMGIDPEREQIVHRVQRRLKRMSNLLDDIGHLGSLESSLQEESCRRVDEVIADIVGEFEPSCITVSLSEPREPIRLRVSESKLYQLLRNLCENAVGFSPEPGTVHVEVAVHDDHGVLRVSDRGPGILPEITDQIGTRFFSYRPENEAAGHSGLGLAIVSAILVSCGGRLTFANRPEGGAEFVATVPLAR